MEFEDNISPEKIELEFLQSDIQYYTDYMRGFVFELLDAGVSKYPIFVFHKDQQDLNIGKPLLLREGLNTKWSVNISVLEEFVKNGLISREMVRDFRMNYKDPETYFCIFALLNAGPKIIFVPIGTDNEGNY